jgi:hypothetical protein
MISKRKMQTEIHDLECRLDAVEKVANQAQAGTRVITKITGSSNPYEIYSELEYASVVTVLVKLLAHLGLELEHVKGQPSHTDIIKKKKTNG